MPRDNTPKRASDPAGVTVQDIHAGRDVVIKIALASAGISATAFLMAVLIGALAHPSPGAPILALGSFLVAWTAMKWVGTEKSESRDSPDKPGMLVSGFGTYLIDKGSGGALFAGIAAAAGSIFGSSVGSDVMKRGQPETPRAATEVQEGYVYEVPVTTKGRNGSNHSDLSLPYRLDTSTGDSSQEVFSDNEQPILSEDVAKLTDNTPQASQLPTILYLVSDCRECQVQVHNAANAGSDSRRFFYKCLINGEGLYYCIEPLLPGHYIIKYHLAEHTEDYSLFIEKNELHKVLLLGRGLRHSVGYLPHPRLAFALKGQEEHCLELDHLSADLHYRYGLGWDESPALSIETLDRKQPRTLTSKFSDGTMRFFSLPEGTIAVNRFALSHFQVEEHAAVFVGHNDVQFRIASYCKYRMGNSGIRSWARPF